MCSTAILRFSTTLSMQVSAQERQLENRCRECGQAGCDNFTASNTKIRTAAKPNAITTAINSQTLQLCSVRDLLLRCKPIRNNPAPMIAHTATIKKAMLSYIRDLTVPATLTHASVSHSALRTVFGDRQRVPRRGFGVRFRLRDWAHEQIRQRARPGLLRGHPASSILYVPRMRSTGLLEIRIRPSATLPIISR